MNKIANATMLVCLLVTNICTADTESDAMEMRINKQLKSASRGEFDSIKDAGRKPVETMQFFGVKAGMTVLDATSGAGYNAEILSAAVGPEGIVYAQNSHYVTKLIGGAHHRAMIERVENKRLPNVRYLIVDTEDMPFDESMDMAFWGFNMHDVYNKGGETVTLEFLTHIKRALKPGAILAVSEHVGIAGQDNAELHRLETGIVLNMMKKAGFVIEATSDLLANPDDDHSQSIYADGLRYHTDRILVRARKPE